MISFGIKRSKTDNSGFCRDNAGFNLHCFRIFMSVYMYLSINLADILGLQCS